MRSLGFGPNPRPVLSLCADANCTAGGAYTGCTADCCACCGLGQCACQAAGRPCCRIVYGTPGRVNAYAFVAVEENPGWPLGFAVTTPCDAGNAPCGASVALPAPVLQPVKYGCTGGYDSCTSNPTKPGAASGKLVWTLGPTVGGGNATVATGVLKVCVQAVQLVPAGVDPALWAASYGAPPNNDSCLLCFGLAPQTQPVFIEALSAAAPGPDNEGVGGAPLPFWEVAVGRTLTLPLTAVDAVGGAVDIVLLPGVSVPAGAEFTAEDSLVLPVPDGRRAYQRSFVFTPQSSQLATGYVVSLQARSRTTPSLAGPRRDYAVRVPRTRVDWAIAGLDGACPWPLAPGGVCPAAGTQVVTAGCVYVYRVRADLTCSSAPGALGCPDIVAYDLALRSQLLPSCTDCGPVPVSVHACPVGGGEGGSGGAPCCGNGLCDGAETSAGCPQDCPGDADFAVPPCGPFPAAGAAASAGIATCDPTAPSPSAPCCAPEVSTLVDPVAGAYTVRSIAAVLVWTPGQAYRGRTVITCVEVYDRGTAAPFIVGVAAVDPMRSGASAPSLCAVYEVLPCRYCAPAGATMRSLAEYYTRATGWLGLYNANPRISDPDDVAAGQSVSLGPVYYVKPGDSLATIAGKLQMMLLFAWMNTHTKGVGGISIGGMSIHVFIQYVVMQLCFIILLFITLSLFSLPALDSCLHLFLACTNLPLSSWSPDRDDLLFSISSNTRMPS